MKSKYWIYIMKLNIFSFIMIIIMFFVIAEGEGNSKVKITGPQFIKFKKLKITEIKPQGWIKEFLERQRSGLTGNIKVAGYPFNTCLWACEKMKGSSKAWWPYEQTAYYIDGLHRLGLLLNDEELIEKAHKNTRYVLENIDVETGRIGTNLADRWWRWPYASFLRNYMVEYSLTQDRSIIVALHRHYLTFTSDDFADDLELANVEELCWLYGITKDKKLLQMAEKAYSLFKSNIEFRNRGGSDMQFSSPRSPDHHAVVYLELVKIPAILYSHTGKKVYLEEALNGIQKMEKHHMLIAGLPSSTEHFAGISELSSVETCNTAVFPYTYGYFLQITADAKLGDKIEKAVFNAGIGAVAKDFKSHQYFSSPNQFVAALNSNYHGHHPARMAFLPGHDVECCTGNVNRFMPYYAEQMWLRSPDYGLVAALFGPSSVKTTVGKNYTPITISAKTNYPFSGKIEFVFRMKAAVEFPFLIRIPKWCKSPQIFLNGKEVEQKINPGTFFKLERKFTDKDKVMLHLPMEVIISEWPNNGIGIERGPLVFSYPIEASKTMAPDNDKSTPEFPRLELRPKGEWRFALDLIKGETGTIQVITKESNSYPWDIANAPLKIKVPAKKIKNWALHNTYNDQFKQDMLQTPAFPDEIITESETEYLELVPYGSTLLRLTVFPKVKKNIFNPIGPGH